MSIRRRGDLLGDDPLRLGELVGRLLVADSDPFFDEGVITLGQLLDAVLAPTQLAIEAGLEVVPFFESAPTRIAEG